MPLPQPVPYYSQNAGLNGLASDDPAGCWYACAKMMGVYYEGSFFRSRQGVPALTNPNGTHQSSEPSTYEHFKSTKNWSNFPAPRH